KRRGKKVFAVDPSVDRIDGDKTYREVRAIPEQVEAAVLEVPQEDTVDWVRQVAEAGIKNVWIHMNRDTPEAVALAQEKGLCLLTGSCAVMYLVRGLSHHSIHRWVNKIVGKY
ncbi:MAG TPA: CoA-binding protein, partial [Anaeromyxobacteraceae bacterium]|nr:CoA-binding protein [Anaeromyxobacteraceae bacterium]